MVPSTLDAGSPALVLEGVSIRYGAAAPVAVENVSFSCTRGERLSIVGHSGCGKSTVLKAIGGFHDGLKIDGSLTLHGHPITRPDPIRYVVWQDAEGQMLPWLTVAENVAYPLIYIYKRTKKEVMPEVQEALKKVKLSAFADRYPHELSGGQRQRVSIARALLMPCEVLLMDEPFSALDALTRSDLQDEFLDLFAQSEACLVWITHDLKEAAKIGHRVLVLDSHPGRVKRIVDTTSRQTHEVEKELDALIKEEKDHV